MGDDVELIWSGPAQAVLFRRWELQCAAQGYTSDALHMLIRAISRHTAAQPHCRSATLLLSHTAVRPLQLQAKFSQRG